MIAGLAAEVKRCGPLKITEVSYSDPTVILIGSDWSLAITCPWRLTRAEVVLVNWDDDTVEDVVWDLVGHSIVDVRARSAEYPSDPFFTLSGDLLLRIESDTDLDPWVLQLPDMTYVGVLGSRQER